MSRLPTPGGDNGAWGSILNDFLMQSLAPDGALKNGIVGSDAIQDTAVTNGKIANGVITPVKLDSDTPAAGEILSYDGSRFEWVAAVVDSGEANTGSNVGTSGVGVYKQKTGVNLEFKNINAGSNKVTITDNIANNEVDIDVAEANFSSIPQSAVTNLTTDLGNKINTSEKAIANGVASLGADGKVPSGQLPTLSSSKIIPYSNTGTLGVATGTYRLYNDSGIAWTINSVRASVGTAPTGAAIIVDINVNETTIFTTQTNRPTIAAAGNTSGKVTSMEVTTIADGSYVTVDIDQVGSTSAGTNLTVQVEVI